MAVDMGLLGARPHGVDTVIHHSHALSIVTSNVMHDQGAAARGVLSPGIARGSRILYIARLRRFYDEPGWQATRSQYLCLRTALFDASLSAVFNAKQPPCPVAIVIARCSSRTISSVTSSSLWSAEVGPAPRTRAVPTSS